MNNYRRKIAGYILALQLLCPIYGSNGEVISQKDGETAQQYRELGRPMREEQIRALSEEKKRSIIELLRRDVESRRQEGGSQITIEAIILDMAILGDDWATTEAVNSFLSKGTRRAPNEMLLLKSPKAIPLMGEALFKDEQFEMLGDVGYMPTQETVSNVILYTLSNSESFSEDVTKWARKVKDRYPIRMMRDWYRENETKLKAWDFKAVQPGAEPPEPKQSKSVDIQPTSPPLPAAPSPSNLKPLSNPPTSGHSGNSYLWIGALLLAVCGCLVWLLLKKRERKL